MNFTIIMMIHDLAKGLNTSNFIVMSSMSNVSRARDVTNLSQLQLAECKTRRAVSLNFKLLSSARRISENKSTHPSSDGARRDHEEREISVSN